MTWQTIETAPKDCAFLGYMIINEANWLIAPMYWSGKEWLTLEYYSDNTEHSIEPTHWMPLPAPPGA